MMTDLLLDLHFDICVCDFYVNIMMLDLTVLVCCCHHREGQRCAQAGVNSRAL